MEEQLLKKSSGFWPQCQWNLVQFGAICVYTMSSSAFWSFPYFVYKYTGLFLVAYYCLLVLICIPVTFLQLKLGGALNSGIVRIFSHYVPALKGVGIGMLVVSFIHCVYNNVYIAYAFYYVFASLKQPYIWTAAVNTSIRISSDYIFFGRTPEEHYFYNDFLQRSSSMTEPGGVPWHLGLSLLAVWIITYFFIFRGPSYFGKVVYITSPLAILVLFTLLIYSHVAIPTAYQSLVHFFNNRDPTSARDYVEKSSGGVLNSALASPLTWLSALGQHLYTVGLWSGILPTLGKHLGNKKPAVNLTWLILLLVHSILPHLATIAMAPFVHALAVHKGVSFHTVINQGPYQLFVVVPEALSTIGVSHFWAFLFYLCFVLFVFHQQALMMLVIIENVAECATKYAEIIFRRIEFLVAAVCGFAYLLGLCYICQGGSYLLLLVDMYVDKMIVAIILLLIPPIVIAYVKLDAYNLPIERLFMCIWFSLASIATAMLLIYKYVQFVVTYMWQKHLPKWQHSLGWCIAVGPILISMILGFAHALFKATGNGREKLIAVFKPTPGDPCPLTVNYKQSEVNGCVASDSDSNKVKTCPRLQERAQLEVSVRHSGSGNSTDL